MPAFMFTDIEGSTRKWQLHEAAMRDALSDHDGLIRRAVDSCGGRIVKHTGDGFMLVFDNGRALECALAIQLSMQEADWTAVDGLAVRIGIHSGEASESSGDYFGDAVNRASRLTAAAWGGQTVASSAAADTEKIPEGAILEDAGIHMLKDLLQPERILVLSHPSSRRVFPPLATLSSSPHNLPVQPTPFVGRKRELGEIGSLIADPGRRLVTVLGHGGSGKTRIALQAAAELVGEFPQGSWFVPLEDTAALSGMVSRIAEAFSLRFAGSQPEEEQLMSFLAGRCLLLVLDNFEHLTSQAPLVSRLLASSPGSKVIVTSRHRLGIREESIYDLSGMSLPGSPVDGLELYDSTSLFLASARRALPSYTPGPDGAASVVRICRMLEGLPLAIELSASWMRTIPPEELEEELGRSLDILENTAGDLPERQRSMQAVFDYSWNLLSDPERIALAGLSVFEGGFSREAAMEVAGCDLRTLQRLCDRSLVRLRAGGGYALHPLTRQQAAEKQDIVEGGSSGLEDRHAAYYRDFLDALHPQTRSSRQTEVFDSIALELPNLRKGALHSFSNFETERMGSFAKTISVLLQLRSRFSEALELFRSLRSVFEKAVAERHCEPGLKTKTMTELSERIGTFLLLKGSCREAESYLSSAVESASTTGDLTLQALCFGGLGNAAHVLGDYDKAEDCWTRALELAREAGNAKSVSSLLCNLASVKKRKGAIDEAVCLLGQAEELNRDSGDPYISSNLLSQIADIMELGGDSRGAEEKYRESLSLRRRVGDLRGISFTLEKLAKIVLERSPAEALPLAEEGLRFAEQAGAGNRIAYCRIQLARVLACSGRTAEASEQLAAAEKESGSLGIPALAEDCASARAFIDSLAAGGESEQP
jgi:predicted ATPase/class 3 adenylate cyclase